MRTALVGLGHHLPPMSAVADVRRPVAGEGGASDLVVPAVRAALAQANLAVDDVDFLVFATMTPDVTFPGAACYLQHKMQFGTIGAVDIRGQCAGFLFGLSVADQFIRAGRFGRVLLAASEVVTPELDYSEGGVRVARLFGDGAGAALLVPAEGESGLRSIVLHSDGRQYSRFWCEYPSSRRHPRMTIEDFRAGRHFPQVDFEAVAQFGISALPAVIDEALDEAGLRRSAIDRFIIGHILPDVVDRVADQMGLGHRVINPSRSYGHLVAASLPVGLAAALATGEIARGAKVCLAACGAGFTWGAAVVQL
jgi:3-oxoacyl-[acyl-carrier-protein] synthase III